MSCAVFEDADSSFGGNIPIVHKKQQQQRQQQQCKNYQSGTLQIKSGSLVIRAQNKEKINCSVQDESLFERLSKVTSKAPDHKGIIYGGRANLDLSKSEIKILRRKKKDGKNNVLVDDDDDDDDVASHTLKSQNYLENRTNPSNGTRDTFKTCETKWEESQKHTLKIKEKILEADYQSDTEQILNNNEETVTSRQLISRERKRDVKTKLSKRQSAGKDLVHGNELTKEDTNSKDPIHKSGQKDDFVDSGTNKRLIHKNSVEANPIRKQAAHLIPALPVNNLKLKNKTQRKFKLKENEDVEEISEAKMEPVNKKVGENVESQSEIIRLQQKMARLQNKISSMQRKVLRLQGSIERK